MGFDVISPRQPQRKQIFIMRIIYYSVTTQANSEKNQTELISDWLNKVKTKHETDELKRNFARNFVRNVKFKFAILFKSFV